MDYCPWQFLVSLLVSLMWWVEFLNLSPSLWSIVGKVTRLPRKWTARIRNVPCLQNMKIIALISISVLPFEQWKSGYKNVRDNQMPWAPGLIFSTLNIVQNANWAFLVCSRPLRCKTLVNISFGMMNNWNVKGEYRVKKSYSKDDKIRRTCHHLPLGTVSSGDFISGIPGLQSACFDFCTLPFLVLGVAAGFVEVWPLDEKGRVVDLKMGFWTTRIRTQLNLLKKSE